MTNTQPLAEPDDRSSFIERHFETRAQWVQETIATFANYCRSAQQVTVVGFWPHIEAPEDRRAMGAVIRHAIRKGWIEKLVIDGIVQSTRSSDLDPTYTADGHVIQHHGGPIPIYTSNLFTPGTPPPIAGQNQLHALNAPRIRQRPRRQANNSAIRRARTAAQVGAGGDSVDCDGPPPRWSRTTGTPGRTIAEIHHQPVVPRSEPSQATAAAAERTSVAPPLPANLTEPRARDDLLVDLLIDLRRLTDLTDIEWRNLMHTAETRYHAETGGQP